MKQTVDQKRTPRHMADPRRERRSSRSIRWGIPAACLAVLLAAPGGEAQEGPAIFINEVISNNDAVPPPDLNGGYPDMVELYNGSDEIVALGTSEAATSYYLTDSPLDDFGEIPVTELWKFPAGRATVAPEAFVTIFCDDNIIEAAFELHATFRLSADGEPLTLWSPEDTGGARHIVDRVWLPPLGSDISIGRYPDGAGPRPVPAEDTQFHFLPHPLDSTSPPTFGACTSISGGLRRCDGAPNGPRVNLPPEIDRLSHSTNRPGIGQPIDLRVAVRDDLDPTDDVVDVEIVYRRVTAGVPGEEQVVAMAIDLADAEPDGIRDGSSQDPPNPSDRWSEWTGSIPAQDTAGRIEFHFRVRETEETDGFVVTRPSVLCSDLFGEGVGPCDREFGGPGCELDAEDVTCAGAVKGQRYVECDGWYTVFVGYEARSELEGLVINEISPLQNGLLTDITGCKLGDEGLVCPSDEDFIELYNASGEEIDLGGLWLSDSALHPRGWQFPEGAKIAPGEFLIVWCDSDGGKCPDPELITRPCFWECPDPTDIASGEIHTDFSLDFGSDEIFLYDNQENGYGVIHGHVWLGLRSSHFLPTLEEPVHRSLSLAVDGNKELGYLVLPATPGGLNQSEAMFRRGDSDSNCLVQLTDAVYILNYLFLGGGAPACPDAADADDSGVLNLTDAVYILGFLFLGGPEPLAPGLTSGVDPSPDDLGPCAGTSCGDV